VEPVSRRRFIGLGIAALASHAIGSLLPARAGEPAPVCDPVEHVNCHQLRTGKWTVATQEYGGFPREWFHPLQKETGNETIQFLHSMLAKGKARFSERVEKGHGIMEYVIPLKEGRSFRIWAKNHFGTGARHTVRIEVGRPGAKFLLVHAEGEKSVPGGWNITLHSDKSFFPERDPAELLRLVQNIWNRKYAR